MVNPRYSWEGRRRRMVNPRDIAGKAEEEESGGYNLALWHFTDLLNYADFTSYKLTDMNADDDAKFVCR